MPIQKKKSSSPVDSAAHIAGVFAATGESPKRIIDDFEQQSLIDLYLSEATQVPLLSTEEETLIGKQIEAGKEAAEVLADSKASRLDVKKLESTVKQGTRARDHLIRANTRLVVSIAQKYINRGLPFCDLIQEGNLGLIKAVEKFNYQYGYRFSTYATWWIRQSVLRALTDQSRTIRMPVHINDQLSKINRIIQEALPILGRKPTSVELAAQLNLDPVEVDRMLQMNHPHMSLEQFVSEDEDCVLGDLIQEKQSPSPPEMTNSHLLQEKIQEVLYTLDAREAKIIQLRFGLLNGYSYSRKEVAQKFGLNRERIRQIEIKALRRMRHPRRMRILRDFWVDH